MTQSKSQNSTKMHYVLVPRWLLHFVTPFAGALVGGIIYVAMLAARFESHQELGCHPDAVTRSEFNQAFESLRRTIDAHMVGLEKQVDALRDILNNNR